MNPSPMSPATTSPVMSDARNYIELLGRWLMAGIFLISGCNKIGGYGATADYMSASGVSGALLPLVIVTELLGAAALIVGFKTRVVAAVLAAFTFMAAILFHRDLSNANEFIHLLKNLAISGGLLVLMNHGAGAFSLDRRRARNRASTVADRSFSLPGG